jgi:cytochrome c2
LSLRSLLFLAAAAALLLRPPAGRAEEVEDGKKLFSVKCYICHTANDPYEARTAGPLLLPLAVREGNGLALRVQNRFGPNLRGVYNSPAGRRMKEGYVHSPSFQEAAPHIVWTEENLDKWLTKTWEFIPGTWMYMRVPDPVERHAIIAFLKQYR